MGPERRHFRSAGCLAVASNSRGAGSGVQPVLQRPPGRTLEHDVACVVVPAHVEHSNGIGVVECCQRPSFREESFVFRGVIEARDLHGDAPVQLEVVRFIDLTHAAAAQRPQNPTAWVRACLATREDGAGDRFSYAGGSRNSVNAPPPIS